MHNTRYAGADRAPVDGIADAAALSAWLAAVQADLPVPAVAIDAGRFAAFRALRDAVRAALGARIEHRTIPPRARRALNDASAACPRSAQLAADATRRIRYHAQDATAVALAAIASETIALVAGPHATDLRACGAPGCVLVFVKDHPRRRWCSVACGNRARQARHYARHRS